jgi:hypothetical protein
MKRPLGIALLVLLVSLVRPAPASAGLRAWLEEWSGPGPFRGYTFLFTACVQDRSFKASPIAGDDTFHTQQRELAQQMQQGLTQSGEQITAAAIYRRLLANPDPTALRNRLFFLRQFPAAAAPDAKQSVELESAASLQLSSPAILGLYKESAADSGPGHADPRLICAYIDQGLFRAPRNDARGFGKVGAHLTDVGPSLRLHDGVDLGAGFGYVTFSGDRVEASPHLTVTPLRLIFRPVTLIVPEEYRRRWMGVFNIYWKETFVVGKLNARDFGSTTDGFAVDGELVRSFGLNFDVTALFPAKWGFR